MNKAEIIFWSVLLVAFFLFIIHSTISSHNWNEKATNFCNNNNFSYYEYFHFEKCYKCYNVDDGFKIYSEIFSEKSIDEVRT